MVQAVDEALVHELVEELHLLGRVVHDVADHVLEHVLRQLHIILQIGKAELRLDHPELRRVTGGVGLLRAEGGSESIYVAEREREGLHVQLTADGQVDGLSEEILAVIDRSVFRHRKLSHGQGRHLEHLAGTLRVTAGDDGRVDIGEASLHEERVDRVRRQGPHAEGRHEGVGARAQVGHGAQVFEGVALLLHRIVRCRIAFQLDALHLHLKGLLGIGCEHDRAGRNDRRADAQLRDPGEILQLRRVHQLQGLETGTVTEHDETYRLRIAIAADPAAHGDILACVFLRLLKKRPDLCHTVLFSHFLLPVAVHASCPR